MRYFFVILLFIVKTAYAQENIPFEVLKAIKIYDPNFKNWNLTNYTKEVLEYNKKKSSRPNFLKKDFNFDGKEDFIVDGANNKECKLLAVISNKDKYILQEIPFWIDKYECKNSLKLKNYYLSINPLFDDFKKSVFSIDISQIEDKNGNLLEDGYIIEYFYDGKNFKKKLMVL